MLDLPDFTFDNSYAHKLEGFYVPWKGAPAPHPEIVKLNGHLARELGLDPARLQTAQGAAILSGSQMPAGAEPLAMVYAGHQFGQYSPQLGDGRALLVGEIIDRQGRRRDIHLKGSGRTPFSRGGDGKAVLGPVLREYLIGEAMHALGIPTTRALAATLTGEEILREGPLPGAVLARVASSHLRVGTFQFFAAQGETGKVRQLADYAIDRHYRDIGDRPDRYLELFRRVRDAQAALIAKWMLTGFVHGVMNTDNTTISGETIDYGPCAFIDSYDPKAVYSSIDQFGRYAYGNQPAIMQWNLARFAETLVHLVNSEDQEDAVRQLVAGLEAFPAHYQREWLSGMRSKLGLVNEVDGDLDLAVGLMAAAEGHNVDFTLLFRALADFVRGDDSPLRALGNDPANFDEWTSAYRKRLEEEEGDAGQRAEAMDRINPLYIPRNHLVEEALAAAVSGDLAPFDRLLERVTHPFSEVTGQEAYAKPAPEDFGSYTTFCGT